MPLQGAITVLTTLVGPVTANPLPEPPGGEPTVPRMPEPPKPDQTDTAAAEVVLGVDTHKDVHVVAVISVLGTLLGSRAFPASSSGYRQLLRWVRRFGVVRRAGVECTGSYGVGLTRYLGNEQVEVIEVNQPDKQSRRRRGKSDALDAEAAARAVLSGRASARAKSGDGPVEMLRVFKLAKASAVKSRTQAINQLKAVLVSANPELRQSLSALTNHNLIRRCSELGAAAPSDIATAAAYTMALLARRILQLSSEINQLKQQISDVLSTHAPNLLQRYGVGPDTAAALLITAGDNPERLHSEASFAALCGVSPVEASSGKTQRRRLNRGGDRRANCALHTIVLARMRWDTPTRDYLARRVTEGKTQREAMRCLKRYLAREIYQLIKSPTESSLQTVAA